MSSSLPLAHRLPSSWERRQKQVLGCWQIVHCRHTQDVSLLQGGRTVRCKPFFSQSVQRYKAKVEEEYKYCCRELVALPISTFELSVCTVVAVEAVVCSCGFVFCWFFFLNSQLLSRASSLFIIMKNVGTCRSSLQQRGGASLMLAASSPWIAGSLRCF